MSEKSAKYKVFLTKKSTFPASHYHEGTIEELEHMHDFYYEVTLYGVTNEEGYLLDFRDVEAVIKETINKKLVYKTLNKVLSVPPTTENVAVWIYDQLKPVFKDLLHSVKLYETPESWIIYEGEK